MNHICIIACFLLGLVVLLAAEPSAFELQSGATKKELKNLQTTNKNLENLAIDYSARIQVLEQSKDGLQSVLDGQALRIKSLLDTVGRQETKIQALQSSLDYQNEIIKQQQATIENLQKSIGQNAALIEQIDSKLKDLAKLNEDILGISSAMDSGAKNGSGAPGLSSTSSGTKPSPSKIDSPKKTDKQQASGKTNSADRSFKELGNKEILDEARKLYREKNLAESKKRYEWLVKNNYKAASSLYMIGEIEYQRSKFQEAIGYYKKSASLDDKASYMPILLWHTAWAFRYSKDMDNYNKFLDSLIRLYPESEQGKKAKDLRKSKTKG